MPRWASRGEIEFDDAKTRAHRLGDLVNLNDPVISLPEAFFIEDFDTTFPKSPAYDNPWVWYCEIRNEHE